MHALVETNGNYYPDCQGQPDLEVEEQAVEDPMPATYIVDGPSSKDSNPVYVLQTLAARIETLLEKISSVDDSNACQHEIIELQKLAGEMGEDHFLAACSNMLKACLPASKLPSSCLWGASH